MKLSDYFADLEDLKNRDFEEKLMTKIILELFVFLNQMD
jgi:hypothetical protein